MELRAEVAEILMGYSVQQTKIWNDENWVGKLVYLVDMLNKMNKMNLSLQEEIVTVFKAMTKSTFKWKLIYWLEYVGKE